MVQNLLKRDCHLDLIAQMRIYPHESHHFDVFSSDTEVDQGSDGGVIALHNALVQTRFLFFSNSVTNYTPTSVPKKFTG
jgi:hypothetical protein